MNQAVKRFDYEMVSQFMSMITAYIDWDQAKVWLYTKQYYWKRRAHAGGTLSMAELHSQVGLLKDEADLTNEVHIMTFKENMFW